MAKDKTAAIDMSAYDYATTKVTGKDGKTISSTGNGDAIQRAFLRFKAAGKDIMQVVRANKLTDKFNPAQYDNAGRFRMSVGNTLRAMVRAGETVTIGDTVVKSLDQKVALPELADAPASKPKKAAAKKAAPKKAKAKRTPRRQPEQADEGAGETL